MATETYCYHCGRKPATEFQSVHVDWSGDTKLFDQRPFCKACTTSGNITWLYVILAVLIVMLVLSGTTLYDEYAYSDR